MALPPPPLASPLPALPVSVKYPYNIYKKNSYNSFYKANPRALNYRDSINLSSSILLEMATVSVDLNIDYQFILFVLFAIGICSTAPVYFYNRNKYFAGFASLVLFILIFVFYGMRWFSGSTMAGPAAGYKGAWPPQISVCPDYLTYYESGTGSSKTTGCYNATGAMIGSLTSGTSTTTAAQFNQTYNSKATPARLTELCNKAKEKSLTWEGITNGESCTF